MTDYTSNEPFIDMFIFETQQLIEQLEQLIIKSEKKNGLETSINEMFRIMHTIKGSSAMMEYESISSITHAVEDVFGYIRKKKPRNLDYKTLTEIVLGTVDFIKSEVSNIQISKVCSKDASENINLIEGYLSRLKQSNSITENQYKAELFFEEGCQMENIRAFEVIHRLGEFAEEIVYWPEDIMDNDQSADIIVKEGFKFEFCSTLSLNELKSKLQETMFIKDLSISICENSMISEMLPNSILIKDNEHNKENSPAAPLPVPAQTMISVSTQKLDMLMDLVGELVISEAMVIQNPELNKLKIDSLRRDAIQLQKITNELRDIVMSVRMVPLSVTFQKMNRIVRDMSSKLNKEIDLEILGAQTEVDKNIIEMITDPLMHIIRNSIDHGIESQEERIEKGKPQTGKITLEAKNAGGDVWITVKDDGRGLDKTKIIKKAKEAGMLEKAEGELSDKEIFSYIFLPGFSTNDVANEFSGRGVGLDVVQKNIAQLGGTIQVDSIPDHGTSISVIIPLTLAIIDGMLIKVGNSTYTIPIINIKESFRGRQEDIIVDTNGNEMIMVRGKCYRLVRLQRLFNVCTEIRDMNNGIVIIVEDENNGLCLFADSLIGQQQVVIKALPEYLKKVKGISGCTLLGNGDISLIIDVSNLIK